MPFVTRTPSSSCVGAFIGLRKQFAHFFVRLRAAVAIKLPNVAHFADHVEVKVGDDDGILVARAFRYNLAAWIGEITLSVEFAKIPGLLCPDTINRAHR